MKEGLEKYSVHELAEAIREKGSVCIVWSFYDIQALNRKLSDEEAQKELDAIAKELNDSSIAHGWGVIEMNVPHGTDEDEEEPDGDN